MTLSRELSWRGFINQTTIKDLKELDKPGIKFYLGIDPSADSLTVGHLAVLILARHLIDHGHQAYLLVGGATGLIGDPDGKAQERELISFNKLSSNKRKLAAQYKSLMRGAKFKLVDNYDWFKCYNYLSFLRDIGKHVPLRQMLAREFVSARLSDNGISYAEFSYCLIQAYDFLFLSTDHGVSLQICGSDQWGNCVAGVDLIRRKTNKVANVLSAPLIINKSTGVKFGKTEEGAVWLDPTKSSPTSFYQFWVNLDDQSAADYLKIYTFLTAAEIAKLISEHQANPQSRLAQIKLANEVTTFVHGRQAAELAREVTDYLTQRKSLASINRRLLKLLRSEVKSIKVKPNGSVISALTEAELAASNGQARELLSSGAISVNGKVIEQPEFNESDFLKGKLLLRKGKAFKDTALVEL